MSNYDEFMEGASDVNQDAIEHGGSQYPVIQWNNGDQKQKKHGGFDYHGGWFVSEEKVDLSGVEGWEKVEWVHDNGTSTDGFWAPELSLSVIRKRQWWEVTTGNQRQIFTWNDYDAAKAIGNPRGRTQYVVMVKGMEDRGLFMVTLRGTSAMAFDSRKGALSKMTSTVVKSANAFLASKKQTNKMPFYSFWLRVGYSRDDKGQPLFTEVGKGKETSMVCLPMALDFPVGDEKVEFLNFYVGKELNGKAGEYFNDTKEWAESVDAMAAGEKAQAGATPTAQNVDDLAEKAAEYGI